MKTISIIFTILAWIVLFLGICTCVTAFTSGNISGNLGVGILEIALFFGARKGAKHAKIASRFEGEDKKARKKIAIGLFLKLVGAFFFLCWINMFLVHHEIIWVTLVVSLIFLIPGYMVPYEALTEILPKYEPEESSEPLSN